MGAWRLHLRDLKQLSLNGIKYSCIDEETKKEILEKVFEPKWKEWIDRINSEEF